MIGQCVALLFVAAAVTARATTPYRAGNLRSESEGTSLAVDGARKVVALTAAHAYYHSTEELAAEVRRLAQNCSGLLSIDTLVEGDVAIDVAYVEKPDRMAHKRNRFSILTGEHARELIGPETVLHMLKMLCGEVPAEGMDLYNVLQHNTFQVIFNANPHGRGLVEAGSYCVRANPNGIDLNRNYDEKFKMGEGGEKPFSEPETIITKKLLSSYKPTSFLSVHSGTLGLYMPWAYAGGGAFPTRNKEQMMAILQTVDGQYCRCPFGAAGTEVGYPCPGTSVDWVYDQLGANFSFAWEVWVDAPNAEQLRQKWKQAEEVGLLQLSRHSLGSEHFRDFFKKHPSDFVHHASFAQQEAGLDEDSEWCLSHFNPVTQRDYDEAVQNWALGYLSAADLIGTQLVGNRGTSMVRTLSRGVGA